MAQTYKVAFIGLGVMGYPMAGHLAKAGHDVTVFNRTAEKAKAWADQFQGHVRPTPAEASKDADYIFACVGNDEDVREVITGVDGAFQTIKPGTIFVDHTTTSAELARDLDAACRAKSAHFIDAPVSGGQAGAENGALTIMMGGEPDSVARIEPIIKAYAKMHKLMGPAGSGQLTKMVNQICIAGLVQGLAEALNFANASGIDSKAAAEVISGGAAQSWQMDNRANTMIDGEFDFGFAVDWMRKDLGYALAEASRVGAALPVTALVDQFYGQVQARGGGRYDTSSLILPLADARMRNKQN